MAAPLEGYDGGGGKETGAHFLWKWGYHFPITIAIRAGGLQKPGNKVYRNTIFFYVCLETTFYKIIDNAC